MINKCPCSRHNKTQPCFYFWALNCYTLISLPFQSIFETFWGYIQISSIISKTDVRLYLFFYSNRYANIMIKQKNLTFYFLWHYATRNMTEASGISYYKNAQVVKDIPSFSKLTNRKIVMWPNPSGTTCLCCQCISL